VAEQAATLKAEGSASASWVSKKGDQSIHPRNENGRRKFEKVNTCANSTLQKRLTRQLAGIEKHLERHPNDGLSRQRVSTIKFLMSGAPISKAKAA
jgi:hypothetical protein